MDEKALLPVTSDSSYGVKIVAGLQWISTLYRRVVAVTFSEVYKEFLLFVSSLKGARTYRGVVNGGRVSFSQVMPNAEWVKLAVISIFCLSVGRKPVDTITVSETHLVVVSSEVWIVERD